MSISSGDLAHGAEAAYGFGGDWGKAAEARSVHVTLAGAEAGHAAEFGSAGPVSAALLDETGAAITDEAGAALLDESAAGPSSGADSGHALDSGSVHATLAKGELGHAADAGQVSSGGTSPHSADSARAIESAFYGRAGADARPAAAEGFSVQVAAADRSGSADAPVRAWPSARDASRAAERPLNAWPSASDAGHGTEAVRPLARAGADAGHGSDVTHEVGIWTYIPSGVRLLLRGRFRPPRPPEQITAERDRLTVAMTRLAGAHRWVSATVRLASADRSRTAEKGQIPARWGD